MSGDTATTAEIEAALSRVWAALQAAPPPKEAYIRVGKRWHRIVRRVAYGKLLRALPRFRGARGRKRAIAWKR